MHGCVYRCIYICVHMGSISHGKQGNNDSLNTTTCNTIVFSFYRGAEHAGLCLKFNTEKEVDLKKKSRLKLKSVLAKFKTK